MATPFFRFGAFRIDTQARELFEDGERVSLPLSTIDCLIYLIGHRDRPVGRDELASAVWGRVDVSEVSLSHAVMRLRRVLGDDGNAQRMIRTVPRLGYRWVMAVTVEEVPPTPALSASEPAAFIGTAEPIVVVARPVDTSGPTTGTTLPRARRRRRWMALGVALAVSVAATLLGWTLLRSPPPLAAPSADSAIVLPVTVDAAAEWAWLRLGLMDLIATQLRRGELATLPSETVVDLVKARASAPPGAAVAQFPAALVIDARAVFAQGRWTVRLQSRGTRRTLEVEASDDDAIKAARRAADELLIKLGHTPPTDAAGDAALAEATLRQRVNAAVLAGQLDVARRLIDNATPSLRASPEIVLSQAKVEFFAGEYERCRELIESLLARLEAPTLANLRARALTTLGATYFRLTRIDEAGQAYAQATHLLEGAHQPDLLAKAYMGSAGVASQRLQLDAAAADYGRARTLLEIGNDAFGVAAVDLNLGMNAMQRGQPAAALPLLQGAAERFEKFAAEDALAATWIATVDVQLDLLDHAGALATSAGFANLQSLGGNQRQRWELTLARAEALIAVGRLGDADALLSRILDASDPAKDAVVRAQANAQAAGIAVARREFSKAADLSAAAMTPLSEAHNRDDYADLWALRVGALQQAGDRAGADTELTRLRAWVEPSRRPHEQIRLELADASQAEVDGHLDAALRHYAAAMDHADARGIPEEMVEVAQPYVRALVAAHRTDTAASVNGRIAPWADRDMRAAWTAALVYTALDQSAAAARALERARSLAGERTLIEIIHGQR